MVDWSSPQEIAKDYEISDNLAITCLGLYSWEIFVTLDFEWSLLTRKRKFTWPMYSVAIIGIADSLDCQTVTAYSYAHFVSGSTAVFTASALLLIRAIALWKYHFKAAIPLGLLCFTQFALFWGVTSIVSSGYSEEAQRCVFVYTNYAYIKASYILTIFVDFIVLCFTVAALRINYPPSGLWNLLFRDGVAYLCIAAICHITPTVIGFLDLNAAINASSNLPAATILCIAACRLILRLLDYQAGTPTPRMSTIFFVNTSPARNSVPTAVVLDSGGTTTEESRSKVFNPDYTTHTMRDP